MPVSDPLGSQAPLFYGPIQQSKDGWNAAFFCGSNALLRREAMMQLGVSRYVGEVTLAVNRGIRSSRRVLARARREHGIGYIPEDRHRHGLLLQAPLWENRMLGHVTQRPNSRGPWLTLADARADTQRIVAEYDVRTPGVDVPAASLSGGNQQKLIVGREMSHHPRVLIAAHPTRGVDVGAQAAIWDQLRDARKAGLATLLISADLEELIGLSDRLLVIFEGRIVADLDPGSVTPTDLGEHMTGSHRGEAA